MASTLLVTAAVRTAPVFGAAAGVVTAVVAVSFGSPTLSSALASLAAGRPPTLTSSRLATANGAASSTAGFDRAAAATANPVNGPLGSDFAGSVAEMAALAASSAASALTYWPM